MPSQCPQDIAFFSVTAFITLLSKMESSIQQPQSTRSRPMLLITVDREPRRALRPDSTSFQTIINRGTTTSGRHFNSAAFVSSPTAWEITLGHTAHDDRHGGNSEDQISKSSMMTEYSVIMIGIEELQ